jgi:hypothetical protein
MWASTTFNVGFAGYEALVTVFSVRELGLSTALALSTGGVAVLPGVLFSRVTDHMLGSSHTLVLAAAFSASGPFVVVFANGNIR